MPLSGPETPVLIRPDFTVIFGVLEVESLRAQKIAHPDPVRPEIEPPAVRGADGYVGPVAAKALARLFTLAGGLVGFGDPDIGETPVLEPEPSSSNMAQAS